MDNIHDEENSSGEEEGFEFVLGGSEGIGALGTTVMEPELHGCPSCRRSMNLCNLFVSITS